MWHPYEMQPSLPTCHQTSWTITHTLLGVLDDIRLLRIVRTLVDVLQINSVTFLFESEHEKNFQLSHLLTHSLPLLHFGFQHGYLQRMLGLDWAGLGWVG